ncbi:PorP/SprF family type IX secretion system membrane protein [Saprospiraceae bacterium]|nr:PorP/SprF family type IX secretion system membrane protein [Saprospiraceae bacterium]
MLRISFALVVFAFSFVPSSNLIAQDLHYDQFYNAPLSVSPALTGIFNGDERFSASYRDQGRSIPVPYQTVSLGYDRKIYPKRNKKGFFGVGGFFNYDKQGDSDLRLLNLNLAGSYTRLLNSRNAITLGALVGYANRAFDPVNLTWDSQFNTTTNTFDPSLSSNESFDFENFNFVETSLGLNYRWQKSARTKLDLGVGAYHLTQPSSRFYNSVTQDLPIRLAFYGIYSRKLTEKLDLQLDALYQRQTSYREVLAGGYLNFYLKNQRGSQRQVRVGGGYKFNADVLFFKLGFQLNQWFVAASYDLDFSRFADQHPGASGRGPEIHLQYIIKHVKPPGKFKVCPIF